MAIGVVAGPGSWTVPSNVNMIDYVDCIGPGAAGGSGAGQGGANWSGVGGTGGGGGAYSRKYNIPVTPGQVINYDCNMSYTQFGPNLCLAYGGSGQTGGNAAAGVGDTRYYGGNGGSGGGNFQAGGGGGGGGGGGAGGPYGNGNGGGAGGNASGEPTGGGAGGGAGDAGNGGGGGGPGAAGGNGLEYGSWGAGGGGGGGTGGFDSNGTGGGPGGYYGAGGAGGGGTDGLGAFGPGAGGPGAIGLIYWSWTVVNPPTITGCSPNVGPVAGGTSVTLTGTVFMAGTTVTFGGAAATNIVIVNATTITCKTPAHAVGLVNIVVTQIGGSATGTNMFTYTSAPGGNMPMMGI